MARSISKEYGVEVKAEIADDAEYHSRLASEFNGSNRSDEEDSRS